MQKQCKNSGWQWLLGGWQWNSTQDVGRGYIPGQGLNIWWKKNLILQRYNFYCHNPCPHKQTDFILWKQCSCGQMRYCETRQANCNCDGTRSGVKDEGKILDKTLLPIQKVHFGLDSSSQLMDVEIGNVVCGPKPFGKLYWLWHQGACIFIIITLMTCILQCVKLGLKLSV